MPGLEGSRIVSEEIRSEDLDWQNAEVHEPSTAIVVMPETGVVVNLDSEREISIAYRELKALKERVIEAEKILRDALRVRGEVLATKTFHIEGVGKVELRGGSRVDFPDPQALEEELRAVGCPEDVIREIVVEQVTWKVDGNRARRAAGANPVYAEIIERHKRVTDPLPSVHMT